MIHASTKPETRIDGICEPHIPGEPRESFRGESSTLVSTEPDANVSGGCEPHIHAELRESSRGECSTLALSESEQGTGRNCKPHSPGELHESHCGESLTDVCRGLSGEAENYPPQGPREGKNPAEHAFDFVCGVQSGLSSDACARQEWTASHDKATNNLPKVARLVPVEIGDERSVRECTPPRTLPVTSTGGLEDGLKRVLQSLQEENFDFEIGSEASPGSVKQNRINSSGSYGLGPNSNPGQSVPESNVIPTKCQISSEAKRDDKGGFERSLPQQAPQPCKEVSRDSSGVRELKRSVRFDVDVHKAENAISIQSVVEKEGSKPVLVAAGQCVTSKTSFPPLPIRSPIPVTLIGDLSKVTPSWVKAAQTAEESVHPNTGDPVSLCKPREGVISPKNAQPSYSNPVGSFGLSPALVIGPKSAQPSHPNSVGSFGLGPASEISPKSAQPSHLNLSGPFGLDAHTLLVPNAASSPAMTGSVLRSQVPLPGGIRRSTEREPELDIGSEHLCAQAHGPDALQLGEWKPDQGHHVNSSQHHKPVGFSPDSPLVQGPALDQRPEQAVPRCDPNSTQNHKPVGFSPDLPLVQGPVCKGRSERDVYRGDSNADLGHGPNLPGKQSSATSAGASARRTEYYQICSDEESEDSDQQQSGYDFLGGPIEVGCVHLSLFPRPLRLPLFPSQGVPLKPLPRGGLGGLLAPQARCWSLSRSLTQMPIGMSLSSCLPTPPSGPAPQRLLSAPSRSNMSVFLPIVLCSGYQVCNVPGQVGARWGESLYPEQNQKHKYAVSREREQSPDTNLKEAGSLVQGVRIVQVALRQGHVGLSAKGSQRSAVPKAVSVNQGAQPEKQVQAEASTAYLNPKPAWFSAFSCGELREHKGQSVSLPMLSALVSASMAHVKAEVQGSGVQTGKVRATQTACTSPGKQENETQGDLVKGVHPGDHNCCAQSRTHVHSAVCVRKGAYKIRVGTVCSRPDQKGAVCQAMGTYPEAQDSGVQSRMHVHPAVGVTNQSGAPRSNFNALLGCRRFWQSVVAMLGGGQSWVQDCALASIVTLFRVSRGVQECRNINCTQPPKRSKCAAEWLNQGVNALVEETESKEPVCEPGLQDMAARPEPVEQKMSSNPAATGLYSHELGQDFVSPTVPQEQPALTPHDHPLKLAIMITAASTLENVCVLRPRLVQTGLPKYIWQKYSGGHFKIQHNQFHKQAEVGVGNWVLSQAAAQLQPRMVSVYQDTEQLGAFMEAVIVDLREDGRYPEPGKEVIRENLFKLLKHIHRMNMIARQVRSLYDSLDWKLSGEEYDCVLSSLLPSRSFFEAHESNDPEDDGRWLLLEDGVPFVQASLVPPNEDRPHDGLLTSSEHLRKKARQEPFDDLQLRTWSYLFNSEAFKQAIGRHNLWSCCTYFGKTRADLGTALEPTSEAVSARWGPCPHFKKGFCRYGDQCRYEHTSQVPTKVSTEEQDCEPRCHASGASDSDPTEWGFCRYGDQCRYEHSSKVPEQASSEEQNRNLRGRASEDSGNAPGDWKVCPYFNKGRCRYGDKCRYKHHSEVSVQTSPEEQEHKPGNCPTKDSGKASVEWEVCPHFQKGFCRYGAECRYEHDPVAPKTESVSSRVEGAVVQEVQVCPHFARGYCKRGNQCGYLHDGVIPKQEPVDAEQTPPNPHKSLSVVTKERLRQFGLLSVCFRHFAGQCKHKACQFSHRALKAWEVRVLKQLLGGPSEVQTQVIPPGQNLPASQPVPNQGLPVWQPIEPPAASLSEILQQEAQGVSSRTSKLTAARPASDFRKGFKVSIPGSTILRRKLGDHGTSRVVFSREPGQCRPLCAQPCAYARSCARSTPNTLVAGWKAHWPAKGKTKSFSCSGNLPATTTGSRFPMSSYVANPPGTKAKVAAPTAVPPAGGSQAQWHTVHQSVFQRMQWADVADTSEEELDEPADESSISAQPLNAGGGKKVVDRSTRRKLRMLKNDAFWKLRRFKPLPVKGRVEAPQQRDNALISRNVLVDPHSAQVPRCVLDSLWSKLAVKEVLTIAPGTGQGDALHVVECDAAQSNQSLPRLTVTCSTGCPHPGEPDPGHCGLPGGVAEDRTFPQVNANQPPSCPSQVPRFVLNSLWSKLAHEGKTVSTPSACKPVCAPIPKADGSVCEEIQSSQSLPDMTTPGQLGCPQPGESGVLESGTVQLSEVLSNTQAAYPPFLQVGEQDLDQSGPTGDPVISSSFPQASHALPVSRVVLDSVWARPAPKGTTRPTPRACRRGRSPPGEQNLASCATEGRFVAERSSCQVSLAMAFACCKGEESASNEHCLGGDHLSAKAKKRTSSQNSAQNLSQNPGEKRDKALAGQLIEALDLSESTPVLKVPRKDNVVMEFDKTKGYPGEGPPKKSGATQVDWGQCPHFQKGFCSW